MDLFLRAPDHLGDGVQALPVVADLAVHARVRVQGPGWVPVVYRDLGIEVADGPGEAPVAVLLKPSFSAAWRARRVPRRVGLATDGRWWLLTDAVEPGRRHRGDDYAAVARALFPEISLSPPVFVASLAERAVARGRLRGGEVLLLPGTASPKTARWRGFSALAEALARRVHARPIFTGGPDEQVEIERIAGRHVVIPPPSLPDLAALAVEVVATGGVVVGNDSGLTHLAAAAVRGAGLDPAKVHVVYGSTDPFRTGPPGTMPHHGTRPPCWPCYAKRCPFGAPCLDASWQEIARLVEEGG